MSMNFSQFVASNRLLVFSCAAIVGTTFAVAIGAILNRRRRIRKRPYTMPFSATHQESPPSVGPSRDTDFPSSSKAQELLSGETEPSVEPSTAVEAWPNAQVSGEGISKDWAEFVRDRLGELDPASCDNETKWALGVVDFLDELKEADAEASSEELASSASLRAALLACLSNKGFALEDSDEWNPDKQRAVAVVRKPDATATTILGKGSTGLSRTGKIIRKQEVKILTKGN